MAVRISIDEQQITAFCRRYHIRKLALFGSVLRDDFGAESDVDILVEFDPGHVPGFGFVDLQGELGQLIGRKVDLCTPGFLSPYIRDRVMQERLVLYDVDR